MRKLVLLSLYFILFAIIPVNVYSSDFIIKGTIKDSQTGQPLPNANIKIEGTSIGAISDVEGKFSLKIPQPGNYVLQFNYIGYKKYRHSVQLAFEKNVNLDIGLKPTIIEGQGVTVTANADINKALERETPVAFTKLDVIELKSNYTTGDLPDLIQDVPGVWTSSAGIGESEIIVRGFNSDKVRFMVNGIPMNEPEDNQVYWSNWSSLSNTAQSIEVHRGPGFSLYGPAAFGGSVHIETMGVSLIPGSSLRFSSGMFRRIGINKTNRKGKIFDPNSPDHLIDVNNAINYTYSLRMNSGPKYGGKLNLSGFLEYKTGDSYLFGTTYDGYSIGLEAESLLNRHFLRLSFFIAPQQHNQAFALQDIDLLNTIGREYNRKNHSYQENYYSKPFLSLKHEWNINRKYNIVNNAFVTLGNGADQTLVNDNFDVTTGIVDFQPVSYQKTIVAFGSHAGYLFKNFGLRCEDFLEALSEYDTQWFKKADAGKEQINLFADNHDHSWQRRDRRDHKQFGLNSYFQWEIRDNLKSVIGVDGQIWRGHREAEVWYLRFAPGITYRGTDIYYLAGDNVQTDQLQSIYNYDTEVNKYSFFARINYQPFRKLNLQTGGQFASTKMKVIENPIRLIDIGSFLFFEESYRTSADQIEDGIKKFKESDYRRSYTYFSPWIGLNYNLTEKINLFSNLATSQKEPAILDWYDFDKGPLQAVKNGKKLKPEKGNSFETGFGYNTLFLKTKFNYYYTQFKNKIESVIDNERRLTTNAGQAVFQGIECEMKSEYKDFDFIGTATFARNRWQKMDVDSIFDAAAEDVVGKVVPFAPGRMFSSSVGYRFEPYQSHLYHLKIRLNYWDDYYGTYTNYYVNSDGKRLQAKLPYFLDMSIQLSFTQKLKKTDLNFRIDVNNVFNRRKNYMRAQYTVDYTRSDGLDDYRWYVLQAPLLNVFFTAEVAIH